MKVRLTKEDVTEALGFYVQNKFRGEHSVEIETIHTNNEITAIITELETQAQLPSLSDTGDGNDT